MNVAEIIANHIIETVESVIEGEHPEIETKEDDATLAGEAYYNTESEIADYIREKIKEIAEALGLACEDIDKLKMALDADPNFPDESPPEIFNDEAFQQYLKDM
jgi:hypothetical protein